MIIEAKIITQPISGKYIERIYDNESVWDSPNWTYIKFTNNDYSDWCGVFRGSPIDVVISEFRKMIIVLTSDYLYHVDLEDGKLKEIENHLQYINLTLAPNGDFIISDFNYIERFTTSIKYKEQIISPFLMDCIKFENWESSKLEFTCFMIENNSRILTMIYDAELNLIKSKYEI